MTTRAEIVEGIAEILEEVVGVKPSDVAEDKTFTEDLDVDSLSGVEVIVSAEERFGIKIPDADCEGLKTVGDLASFVEKALA